MELLSSKNQQGSSTLKYVDIETIEDGVIRLKNGGLRAVLLVSSVNFDLKSSDEQTAIIGGYQNFLNSLDFPLQIIVSSRRLNTDPYLARLEQAAKTQSNELLRLQTQEYGVFIKDMASRINIMSKFFYVVVPFAPIESQQGGFLDKISTILNPRTQITERRELFETYKTQLWQRVDHVAAALSGTGLHLTALNTEELIELFYNAYNPSTTIQSVIGDISKIELQKRR